MTNSSIQYIGNPSYPDGIFPGSVTRYVVTMEGDTIGFLHEDGTHTIATHITNADAVRYLRSGDWIILPDYPFKVPAFSEFKTGKGTTYLGRNGNGKVAGMLVQKMVLGGTELMEIAPINSKGDCARCYIQLPIGDVPALIKALQEQMRK